MARMLSWQWMLSLDASSYLSPRSGSVGPAGVLVLPDDLARAVQLDEPLREAAGRQYVAVGQLRRHRRGLHLGLPDLAAGAVELDDLVALAQWDQNVIVRQQVEAAPQGVVVAGDEALVYLPGRVEKEALAVWVRQTMCPFRAR